MCKGGKFIHVNGRIGTAEHQKPPITAKRHAVHCANLLQLGRNGTCDATGLHSDKLRWVLRAYRCVVLGWARLGGVRG